MILALDTTAEFGSIALGDEEMLLHAPEGFGAVIFQHIEKLLQRANVKIEDVDGFAAAAGPGSFTGVRIGLACAKGLAEATGKPAYGVSNLVALARFGSADQRATIIDARRGEVYAALYGVDGIPILPERVLKFAEFLAGLPDGTIEFISQDLSPFAPVLAATRFTGAWQTTAPRALAPMIAAIAEERMGAGEAGDPAGLDANYVRRSDAELLFKTW